ncbi:hypothetical protein [Enterococcus faecalis]|uniref:hypothetical protein n=1 Tax=Enterococcus faecalis TaxID=1351 RepID=UPI001F624F75|nr:hypothetical protein [Enterococcus faecalis]
MKLSKKQIIGVSVVAIIALAGVTGLSFHNKQVQAEKIELAEKKEKEAYKKLTLQVDDSVKKAYDTRNTKDIEMAEIIIKKLKEQDQKDPKSKMTKLHSFLDLIKKTDGSLAKAEKTKADTDIQSAQKSIDEEKDPYLSKDKKAHQIRLDKLKKSIADQKAKEKAEKEKEEKTSAEVAQVEGATVTEPETQTQAQAVVQQPEIASQSDVQPAEAPEVVATPETPVVSQENEASYQAPATPQAPVQTAPAPQTPTYQPPVAQAPASRPNNVPGRPSQTQEELNQGAKEDAISDWSEFYK